MGRRPPDRPVGGHGPLLLDAVTHRYVASGGPEDDVVRDVTLRLSPGEGAALVGPNGAGKSTLLAIAAGRVRPWRGTASLGGRPVQEHDVTTRRRVAVLEPRPSWYPDLSIREHLRLVAGAHGVVDADEVVERVLVDHRLAAVAARSPLSTSSGQQQRLALATLRVRPASLLVLDEPEQHLDAAGREHLGGWLRSCLARGAAVLLATHDEDVVRRSGCRPVAVGGPVGA